MKEQADLASEDARLIQETEQLNTHLALNLAPLAATPSAVVQQRLLQKVQLSRADHASFITVRHGDTPWSDAPNGVRTRLLHAGPSLRSRLLALRAGTVLPDLDDAKAQEIVVLEGALRKDQARFKTESLLIRTGAQNHQTPLCAETETLLFVRERLRPHATLPAAEAQWWPEVETPFWAAASSQEPSAWLAFSPGVHIKPLKGNDASISILAKFEPGASVAAHSHGLDEDCIMLQGDLYLGDVLLRKHEYQLAPQGSRHGILASDFGAVLYFHGALDNNLKGS
jgi:anti-sigma factor ChrR (cupin superfamily)